MERRQELIFGWQTPTESQHHTAPETTGHVVFCVKVTPGVGKETTLGGLAEAWTTVVSSRLLVAELSSINQELTGASLTLDTGFLLGSH